MTIEGSTLFVKDGVEDLAEVGGAGQQLAQFVELTLIVGALYPKAEVAVDGVLLVHVLEEALPVFLAIELRIVGESELDGTADDGMGVNVTVGLSDNLAIDAARSP